MKATRVIQDDDSTKLMFTKEWNNGDWNLRFAVRIQYLDYAMSEGEIKESGKYEVKLLAVSPEAAQNELNTAIESMGMDQDDLNRIPLLEYEALIGYGVYATLWYKQGHNLRKLLHEANRELQLASMLFGFYMDRSENRIGNDGWDFISGNIGFNSKIMAEIENEQLKW